MRTVNEWYAETGANYDRIVTEDKIYYMPWRPFSICESGKVVDCGYQYNDTMLIADKNDIDVIDYCAENPQSSQFFSDYKKWCSAVKITHVSDLIGLNSDDFNKAVNARYEKENGE